MTISFSRFAEITGLGTDAYSGFEAQVAFRSADLEIDWPEHLRGRRVDEFRKGSHLARDWLAERAAAGVVRRKLRGRDFKEQGATTLLVPAGGERLEEQVETLRAVADRHRRLGRIDAPEEDTTPTMP